MSRFTLEPVDVDRDTALLHRWLTHPRSAFWMMQDWSAADVHAEQSAIRDDPHQHAWLGRDRGRPAFLVETYDPAHSPLADLPELRTGDLGMHVLVAPPEGEPERGYTSEVFRAVMEFCFADTSVRRVVVEPDADNRPIRAKNVAAGFVEVREVALPDKTAMLSTCTREDFADAAAVDHLTPYALEQAQRHLVAKAIAEYAHERLIAPTPVGDGTFVLQTSRAEYEFTARQHALEHWVVDAASLVRRVRGEESPLDAQALVAELAPTLGIPDQLLPVYLEEIAATLAAAAWKHTRSTRTTADLVAAVGPAADTAVGFQVVESSMTEGHPAFVANNGRIGFGVDDYHRYAPETAAPVHLEWLAVRRSLGHLTTGDGVAEDDLVEAELGAARVEQFRRRLEALGLPPQEYRFLPVHPWQWRDKLAISFAPDVARRDLVHLGRGEDEHQAQQSIRTFFNATRPTRHYVKVALSIQNMGFMRGLSPAYMEATPAINDWVAATVHDDPVLRELGVDVLREVAAGGYTGDAFHAHGQRSAHQKMLAALWRESPVAKVAPEEGLATMASLLHRDRHGSAFATGLVKASPLSAQDWVRTYLRAYLVPLVHCLYAYDLAFMPHGENLVMVLRDHVPVRMFLKDIGEEVAVMGDLPLPAEVERIRADVPEEMRPLAIHTDVLDGFLRHLAAILDEDGVLPATEFWAIARTLVREHAEQHPELADAAARYDLFAPRFRHSCLNRLQLRNTLEMVDITDQADSLLFAGTLANPLA
ncbi:GNAT family N-acetyltransferase [Nocardioides panacisoli]|uniref:GNAT family N-acetyltransferase n=1 Tax=Nocardioides panacisoli TaxID=627624 RepID=UPI001C635F30|nr:GNAT family N-acetyltransferase [Nocardioides panacisoli]QYJ05108.1 GNAT family N-acetyltransferase [Nocardioides panacisoli]